MSRVPGADTAPSGPRLRLRGAEEAGRSEILRPGIVCALDACRKGASVWLGVCAASGTLGLQHPPTVGTTVIVDENILLRTVYDELRGLAAAMLADQRPGHTLQPTALVNEAYL